MRVELEKILIQNRSYCGNDGFSVSKPRDKNNQSYKIPSKTFRIENSMLYMYIQIMKYIIAYAK